MWKIVIVDDDRQTLHGMKRLIPWEQLDLELVGEAMDGEAGARIITEQEPDIVISDIYMPVKNGLDMIDQLRREQFPGKIVILSGYSDFEYARQALRLGVDDYLSKPITVNTLKDVLGKLIAELEERNMHRVEENELRRKLELYEPFVEQERIRGWVTGMMPVNDIVTVEDDGAYLAMVLEIVRNDRMEGMNTRNWNLFRFAVGNIVKELKQLHGMEGYFVELHGHYMALLLKQPQAFAEERFSTQAEQLARSVIEAAAHYLRIRMQVGIGRIKPMLSCAAESTEEAFQALHDRRTTPDTTVPVFRYNPKGADKDPSVELQSVRFYQEMAEALRGLEASRAEAALVTYCGKIAKYPALSSAMLQQTASELWAIFSYTMYSSGILLEDSFPQEEVHRRIRSISVLEQFKEWAGSQVSEICRRFSRSENLKHKQAVDFMTDYIHEHYAEDIRLAELAEKVFISRNYLSNIFRSSTGETFNDYVTRVRMEKAKCMIMEGKLMIYEIAERVGYKNVPYFTTLFKKHTGRNPSDYVKIP
ncbi:response regulator transcription factor [Paenibacillus gansuensis]|uniref:Response regulator n=1 Tax=Paenibacillus gansuensis TaxID=306542 RepID=A0ABW5PA75_9BACL